MVSDYHTELSTHQSCVFCSLVSHRQLLMWPYVWSEKEIIKWELWRIRPLACAYHILIILTICPR